MSNKPQPQQQASSSQQQPTSLSGLLQTSNLVPMYIIQDNLIKNFRKINNFISETTKKNTVTATQIHKLQQQNKNMKNNFNNKMIQMEKKIITEISNQLDGRIAIAIGKSIQSFIAKIQSKENKMVGLQEQFDRKLFKLKQQVSYDTAMEIQKQILKQTKKIQQSIKKISLHTSSTSNNTSSYKNTNNTISKQSSSHSQVSQQVLQPSATPYPSSSQPQQYLHNNNNIIQQSGGWQQQHHLIKQLQTRIQAMQQFSINVDKRLYNSITSLKDSWKQLGIQLLDNKKNMIKKFDQLKIQFIKLKNTKEFSSMPDKIQDQFKRKLLQKFTDIYQLLSITLTKNQFQTNIQKINSRISRHDDDFIQIRKQLATNNQFFTFYANNADQTDLKAQIQKINKRISEEYENTFANFSQTKNKIKYNLDMIQQVDHYIKKIKVQFQGKSKLIDDMNQIVSNVNDRIQSLQDFNKFGPEKLQKIHNSLDIDFTATQRQLIQSKNKKRDMSSFEQSQRQFKIQLNKMKDQIFLLSSQNTVKQQELAQIKKQYKELQNKMVKQKRDNQQAMASRKPWVCLSCDKQQKEKQQVKKQSKLRKPQPFKGFPQQKSEKLIKPPATPPFQQRFQIYEKLREKYLSDTIKLPQIFKQKLKDNKDASIHN